MIFFKIITDHFYLEQFKIILMNFLAHLYLSCDNEDLMIGNFIADFIRNKEVKDYSPEIQKGIFLHRQIDTYTDLHPMVKKGTHRLQKYHRKYSPVIVDVFYDYLLANNWERYSGKAWMIFAKVFIKFWKIG